MMKEYLDSLWREVRKKDRISLVLFLALRLSLVGVLGVFVLLVGFIFIKGIAYLNLDLFAWEYNSQNVSMMPAIINTLTMVFVSLLIAMPLGIFGAIFLNEYGKKQSKILGVIAVAAETLVGIPSIV